MTLEYQRGSVFVQGKRRKMWYGKYRVWQKDPSTNASSQNRRPRRSARNQNSQSLRPRNDSTT